MTALDLRGAAAVITDRRGRVLMHLRDDAPGVAWPGYWAVPTGACEPGEDERDTMARELFEETGIALPDLRGLFETCDTTDGRRLTMFAGSWEGDERALPLSEGVKLRFFEPEHLATLHVPPFLRSPACRKRADRSSLDLNRGGPATPEAAMTDLKTLQHPRFSRAYLRISETADQRGVTEHRRQLLDGLSGRVIEIGAGQGRNFPHYPPTVTEVLAVEPDDTLRAAAQTAAQSAPVAVRVVAGRAEQLPAADGSYDPAVFCLVLCTITDPHAALIEAARVLRPGGQIRFLEHVRSAHRVPALLEDAVTPVWSRLGGGCHPNRDTAATIRAAGFEIQQLDRFGFAMAPLAPAAAHILGQATKP